MSIQALPGTLGAQVVIFFGVSCSIHIAFALLRSLAERSLSGSHSKSMR